MSSEALMRCIPAAVLATASNGFSRAALDSLARVQVRALETPPIMTEERAGVSRSAELPIDAQAGRQEGPLTAARSFVSSQCVRKGLFWIV